jgi:hypothetical protein
MSGRGCEGRLCCKRELYCPPSHDRITRQRAHRCPPGPVSRPAGTPPRPAPPTDLPQQPSSPLRAPTSSQTRAESATIWGEKPRARHLRSVPAQLCGIRGGRAAPHMHPQALRGVAAAARANGTRTSPNAPAQPLRCSPTGAAAPRPKIAAAAADRRAAPFRGARRLAWHPGGAASPSHRRQSPRSVPGSPLQLGGGPSKQAPAPDQPRQLGPGARARCRTGPVPGAGRMPRDPPGAVRPR